MASCAAVVAAASLAVVGQGCGALGVCFGGSLAWPGWAMGCCGTGSAGLSPPPAPLCTDIPAGWKYARNSPSADCLYLISTRLQCISGS